MKIKIGNIYRTLLPDNLGRYQEHVFKVIDSDYDHHKGYWEFRIESILPGHFNTHLGDCKSLWVKSNTLTSCEELSKKDPVWLLYGK